tara:strand:- start:193 stop:852 length:660 start_codon:yes stop_codon:yes gene_type:complete
MEEKEFNRAAINTEAGNLWNHLRKTASLVNTPVNLMGSRSFKASKREFSLSDDVADKHVSDVLMAFLEKSDEKVKKIISGKGNVKHYLTKCVMTSVMSARSSQNYLKKVDKNSFSLDAPLTADEEGSTFLDYLSAPIEEGVKSELLSIVDEALIGQNELDVYIFSRITRDGVLATNLMNESRVEYGYQKILTVKNHMLKVVLIYVATPEIKERVRQILS